MSKYSEKLKDPRWQKKRLEVFNRDSFECSNCGNQYSMLAVHHLYYEKDKDPWDYPLEAFKTLCRECHEEEYTFRGEYEATLLATLKQLGFSGLDVFALADGFLGLEMKASPNMVSNSLGWLIKNEDQMKIVINKYIDWTNDGRRKRNANCVPLENIL